MGHFHFWLWLQVQMSTHCWPHQTKPWQWTEIKQSFAFQTGVKQRFTGGLVRYVTSLFSYMLVNMWQTVSVKVHIPSNLPYTREYKLQLFRNHHWATLKCPFSKHIMLFSPFLLFSLLYWKCTELWPQNWGYTELWILCTFYTPIYGSPQWSCIHAFNFLCFLEITW